MGQAQPARLRAVDPFLKEIFVFLRKINELRKERDDFLEEWARLGRPSSGPGAHSLKKSMFSSIKLMNSSRKAMISFKNGPGSAGPAPGQGPIP